MDKGSKEVCKIQFLIIKLTGIVFLLLWKYGDAVKNNENRDAELVGETLMGRTLRVGMETTEKIAESYVQYGRGRATISNIKCSGRHEIDPTIGYFIHRKLGAEHGYSS